MPRSRPSPAPVSGPAPLARWRSFVRGSLGDPYWQPRALLWGLLAWSGLLHLLDPEHRPIYGALNLVTHEAGHALFYWTGSTTWSVAGGTLLELAVPLGVLWLFLRQRDPFAATVALFWFGTALHDVSIYVADARARSLPLVSLFPGPPLHDWHYLLARAGWLELDGPLSRLFRRGGLAVILLALVAGADVVRRMRRRDGRGGEAGDTGAGAETRAEMWTGRSGDAPGKGGPGEGDSARK